MHVLQPGRHSRTPSIQTHHRSPAGKLIVTIGLALCLIVLAASPLLADGGPADLADFDGLLWETLPRFDIDPAAVPAHFRKRVQALLYDYTVTYRKLVQDMLRRCASYLSTIKRVLRQEGLPTYYAYIPLAESAFRVDATHPNSGARGLWQLMPETARAYGLHVSRTTDQRLDPIQATRAAARYLSELQAMFGRGTPLLILAAYNYGESNIYKAIVRARTRNIWALMRKWQIPEETRDYLVKMVTMWLIVSNAHLFRFDPTPEPPTALLPYSEITFSRTMGRMVYTERLRLPEAHLRTLPPPLTCAPLPSYTLTYILSTFPVHDACRHTVQSGETLWDIAQRYALRVSALKRLNQLTGSDPVIYPGQILAVCQVPFSSLAADPAF
jgi:hypothetical protein